MPGPFKPARTSHYRFFLNVALVGLIGLAPVRAFAYGIYEYDIVAGQTDAPELYSQAFPTPPPGPDDEGLAAIEGYLDVDHGDLADMYCLYIGGAPPNNGTPYHRFTPQQFTVTTVAPSIAEHTPRIHDPQLFLFDAMGHPVVGNDDISNTNLESQIPLGSVTQSGVYILAVTAFGYDPRDADGNLLFTSNLTGNKTPTNANGVQAGWAGSHNDDGWYRLRFGVGTDGEPDRVIGAEHWIPEPHAFGLLLLGLGMVTLCHRRAPRFQLQPAGVSIRR